MPATPTADALAPTDAAPVKVRNVVGILRGSDRDFVNGNQPNRGLSVDTRGTPIATVFGIGANASRYIAENHDIKTGAGNYLAFIRQVIALRPRKQFLNGVAHEMTALGIRNK